MEKLIRPYDKEHMRMAMLQHEETFKQQVHELHRVYQIQKRLMRSSTDESKRHDNSSGNIVQKKSRLRVDLEQPLIVAEATEVIDETEIELTLGPSSYSRRSKKAVTPLTTSESGGTGSLSSSSTESSQLNRTISNLKGGVSVTLGFQSSTVHGVEEELRQERITHQPPWLYNVLSLNMT